MNINFIKQAVCLNQGELAQYSYLSSILHRNLKEEYAKSTKNYDQIENSLNALVDYLNRNFRRISEKNFELLHLYFTKRSKHKPRICIKANYSGQIIELFRNEHVDYIAEYPVDTNSGFQFVHQNGTYFICNNIPEDAKTNKYNNPRLDNNKVKNYSISLLKKFTSTGYDSAWVSCWNHSDSAKPSSYSSYKSTLIIPMTLWNNDLSDIYRKLTNIENIERTIFGFLCFDHIDTNFFNKDTDIDIGYIFADLLSLFLIQRLNYTSSSETFISALREIEDRLTSQST